MDERVTTILTFRLGEGTSEAELLRLLPSLLDVARAQPGHVSTAFLRDTKSDAYFMVGQFASMEEAETGGRQIVRSEASTPFFAMVDPASFAAHQCVLLAGSD